MRVQRAAAAARGQDQAARLLPAHDLPGGVHGEHHERGVLREEVLVRGRGVSAGGGQERPVHPDCGRWEHRGHDALAPVLPQPHQNHI